MQPRGFETDDRLGHLVHFVHTRHELTNEAVCWYKHCDCGIRTSRRLTPVVGGTDRCVTIHVLRKFLAFLLVHLSEFGVISFVEGPRIGRTGSDPRKRCVTELEKVVK